MSLDAAIGWLAWRLTMTQADTTNLVAVQVTDDKLWAVDKQHLTATQRFRIRVNPLLPLVLTPLGYTNDVFTLSVGGTAGPDCILQGSVNLRRVAGLGELGDEYASEGPLHALRHQCVAFNQPLLSRPTRALN